MVQKGRWKGGGKGGWKGGGKGGRGRGKGGNWQSGAKKHPPKTGPRVSVAGGRFSGEVLAWKGNFGWIKPDVEIEHGEAWKHGGRIYLNRQDVKDEPVVAGARVTFLVYADGDGLGAEQVYLEGNEHIDSDENESDDSAAEEEEEEAAPRTNALTVGPPVQRTIERPAPAETSPAVPKKGAGKGIGKSGLKAASKGKGLPPAMLAYLRMRPSRDKTTHSGNNEVIRWASSEMQGWRPAMEDATCVVLDLPSPLNGVALFGVFDGHGGAKVSKRVSEDLPEVLVSCAQELINSGEAMPYGSDHSSDLFLLERTLTAGFPALDRRLREEGAAEGGDGGNIRPVGITIEVDNAYALMGSTAIVALMEFENGRRPRRLVVANCGDSRASVCREGVAIELSEDQKPEGEVEKARIEAAGGCVGKVGPCFRVDGWGLNLSRALGDFHYKAREDLSPAEQKVSCVPEVRTHDITEQDEFLLLGCDGVYELHNWQDAINVARRELSDGKGLEETVEALVDASCSPALFQTNGQGGDNVSAMIVQFR